jgi:hypothetical protein
MPSSGAKYNAAWRKRREDQGFVPIMLWVHADDVANMRIIQASRGDPNQEEVFREAVTQYLDRELPKLANRLKKR